MVGLVVLVYVLSYLKPHFEPTQWFGRSFYSLLRPSNADDVGSGSEKRGGSCTVRSMKALLQASGSRKFINRLKICIIVKSISMRFKNSISLGGSKSHYCSPQKKINQRDKEKLNELFTQTFKEHPDRNSQKIHMLEQNQ